MIHLAYENFSLRVGGRPIIAPITMDFTGPGVVALLGPSGVGKSSLLRATQNLILRPRDTWQSRGNITLNGHSVFAIKNLARQIGYIHQKPRMLAGSILDNVTFALKHSAGLNKVARRRKAEHVIEQVGLMEEISSLNTPAWCLSGGQAQRLAVARAIALEPAVLLMDEPCSALDPIKSRQLEGLIQVVSANHLVVVVTHDPAFTQRIADQVAFLMPDDGGAQLIANGDTRDIFQAPPKPSVCEFIRYGSQGHCPLIHGFDEQVCAVCAPPGSFERLMLFICDGNTSRSPIAEAICNQLMAQQPVAGVAALSAGIAPKAGQPLSNKARQALQRRGVSLAAHRARPLTQALANRATTIYCMTHQQRQKLIAQFPAAHHKFTLLNPQAEIANPADEDAHVFDRITADIEAAICTRLNEWRTA